MNIHTYLRANNIQLVDTDNKYWANNVANYEKYGQLHSEVLEKLRTWNFKPADILRLAPQQNPSLLGTATSNTTLTPFDEGFIAQPSKPAIKKARWTSQEVAELVEFIKDNSPISISAVAEQFNRTPNSVYAVAIKEGAVTRKGQFIGFAG